MCGLFGFLNYSGKEIKDLKDLTNSLARESAIRGTDATGIAFNGERGMNILKEGKSAYQMNFKHSDDVYALIGHTRHSTGGSKHSYNHHPFAGKCKEARFALAHNGVLYDNDRIRKTLNISKNRIETDSYLAVQILQTQKHISMESIRYMLDKIKGSFSFSILDSKNNIFLVRGDNPLSIIKFPRLDLIVFASTDEILFHSISGSKLISELKRGSFEEIEIKRGEIIKICVDGRIERDKFKYNEYIGKNWWEYGEYCDDSSFLTDYEDFGYIDDIKAVSYYYGYLPEDIDELLKQGFSPWEIEEFLYG